MFTLLDLGRPDVLAYSATDIITDDDMTAATAAFDALLKEHHTVHIYAELVDLRGFDVRALWLDLVYGIRNVGALRHLGRIALVTDADWVRRVARLEARLLPVGSMNVYTEAQRDAARKWIAESPRAPEASRPYDWTGMDSLDAMWSDADWFAPGWDRMEAEPPPTARAPRFGHTVHRTHVLLGRIAQRLGTPGTIPAYHALRSVLHTLRDRLPDAEAADLAAQFTTIVRGVFYEGYRPEQQDPKMDREVFLDAVQSGLQKEDPFSAEDAVQAVGGALAESVSAGEWAQVLHALPSEVRELFEAPVEV